MAPLTMAEIAGKHVRKMSMEISIEDGEETWAKHYSSNHQILLVGEGDFSFSASLARAFGSASNIVASSLDSYDALIKKYKRAKTNLEILDNFGAQLLHGVDSTKMKLQTDLLMRKFDRIVYNFPHAGFLGKESDHLVIMMHRSLVRGFLRNASGMLRPNGEIHVTHKTSCPFNCWNIKELATQCCLTMVECVDFKIEDYPGYKNKRGDGRNPDQPFPLGKCSTFIFMVSSKAKKLTTSHHIKLQQTQEIPLQRGNSKMVMNPFPVMVNNKECFRVFKEYFNHECSTSKQSNDYIQDMLKIGFERYNAKSYGKKTLDGYVYLVEELRKFSRQRVAFLRNWLLELDNKYYL